MVLPLTSYCFLDSFVMLLQVRPYGIDVLVFFPSPVASRYFDGAQQTGPTH